MRRRQIFTSAFVLVFLLVLAVGMSHAREPEPTDGEIQPAGDAGSISPWPAAWTALHETHVDQTSDTFYPAADAYVSQVAPTANFGTETELDVKNLDDGEFPDDRRSYVGFDLSTIPSDATIISATFQAHLYEAEGAKSVDIELRRVTSGWDEETVTWNNRPDSEAHGGTAVSSAAGVVEWDTTDLIQDHWINQDFGTSPNFGLELRGPEKGDYHLRRFYANEAKHHRPHLIVAYEVPTCEDPYEPNESFEKAWTLSPGTIESYICCDGTDYDYFTFLADAGDLIQLDLYDLPSDYNLCLFDPTRNQIDCSQNGGTAAETIEETAANSGHHYALVYGHQGACDSDKPYTLDISVTGGCNAVTGLDIDGPTTVISGTAATFTATVSPPAVSTPITYSWQATEQSELEQARAFTQTTITFTWDVFGAKTIEVTAINCGGTVSATHALTVEGKPDLTITDVWRENGQICYQIRNVGEGTAPMWHYGGLSIDGTPVADHLIETTLAPGERLNRCFEYQWQCAFPKDTISVCADIQDAVAESDETNNCREEVWACDTTPPKITSGPVVSQITQDSARVSWQTDEGSDSVVKFGTYAGEYENQESDATHSTEHGILLTDLKPATVYHYVVKSTDASGNTVTSGKGFFESEPEQVGEPPSISSPTVARVEGDRELYRVTISASDPLGVERVEFYLDDKLIGIDYSPSSPYEFYLDPAALKVSRADFFGEEHTIRARAFGLSGLMSEQSIVYQPEYEPPPINLHVRPNYHPTLYVDPGGTLPAETTIDVRARAAEYEWNCTWLVGLAGIELPPGVSPQRCWEVEHAVDRVIFEVDGSTECVSSPSDDNDFWHECTWDVSGLGVGTYHLQVVAYASDGSSVLTSRYLHVEVGEPSLDVSRSVSRIDNHFQVELTVENRGTASEMFGRIEDSLFGFQPIEDEAENYEVTSYYSPRTRHCDVEIDVSTDAGGDIITLGPGESITVDYVAVPILYPETVDSTLIDYTIGAEPVRIVDYWGGGEYEHEVGSFDRPRTIPYEVFLAKRASDYLIVTNPINLFLTNPSRDSVNELLSAMAELAQRKSGILGYVSYGAHEAKDQIKAWGRTTMRGSDGVEGHYLSNGYLLIVGETEIVPSWTVDIPDMDWSGDKTTKEIPFSDLPYADTVGNDGAPDLIVGRLIGDSAEALARPIEASLRVAEGLGFDRSFGVATSGSEGSWEDFAPSARRIQTVLDDQMDDGASAYHWSRWIHKEPISMEGGGFDLSMTRNDGFILADVDGDGESEMVVVDDRSDECIVYQYGDLDAWSTTPSDAFDCRFTPYDGLAAGDIDGVHTEDEIIVATDESDTIAIFNDGPRHTPGSSFPEFDVDVDHWDVVTTGDVWGDDRDEIILATTDDYGTVYVYSYETGGTYPELILRDTMDYVSFTPWDGFGVGNVSGVVFSKDEIVVANDSTDRIYIYDHTGTNIGEIDADPFTHYDGLAVGDMDGDGMDEFATIIDDVIDGKRRFFVFNNDGWYWDAAEEAWKIRHGGRHKLYARSLEFDGIRTTARGSNHDGFDIGDIDGDGEAEALVARQGDNKLSVLDGHYSRGWMDRYLPPIQSDGPDTDIFTLRGHGSPVSCSPFETGDIGRVDFDAHPLVLGLTCLSGNYEGDWWWIKDGSREDNHDGDDGFAEAFFDSGAAAYIGATHVSSSRQNKAAGPAFFRSWGWHESAGLAFAQYERDRAGTGSESWQYWVTEYNYYGDPKFGAVDDSTVSDAALVTGGEGIGETPPTTLEVSIPAYEVDVIGDEDHVEIPEGDLLLEEGKPQVPYYTVDVELPAGYEVRSVEMVERTGLSTTEGLNLPLMSMRLDCACSEWAGATSSAAGEEWFPTQDFDWRVVPGADSSTLLIMIYPFFYNELTTGVRFYQQYSFDIEYTTSSVAVADLSTDKTVYHQGDTVMIDARLTNSGDAQSVVVDASIERYGSDETVDGLLLRALDGLAGDASFSPRWESAGFGPGHYYVQLVIRDTDGNTLNAETQSFQLGLSSGEVTQLTAAPESFDVGDSVDVSMVFSNTGTIPITGTAVIQVRDGDGEVVEDFRHDVANLAASDAVTIEEMWDTSGAEGGAYDVVGYVLYDSKSTTIKRATVSSEIHVYLPLVLRNR
jgi:hypothetical protein